MIRIIEIESLSNGSHRNQMWHKEIPPSGWAVVPEDMETKNFPFGEITVEEKDGVMTVTEWVAGKEPAPIPIIEEPISDKTIWDIMAEAYSEGVNEA